MFTAFLTVVLMTGQTTVLQYKVPFETESACMEKVLAGRQKLVTHMRANGVPVKSVAYECRKDEPQKKTEWM